MPTVELHGFSAAVRSKIGRRLRKITFRGTLVLSPQSSKPKAGGKIVPFVRIYSRFPANAEKIRKALREFDVEFVKIRFWSKQ